MELLQGLKTTVAVVLACAFLYGCVGLIPSPFRPSPGPKAVPSGSDLAQAFDIVCRNYRLGPDDTVAVLFQTEWSVPPGSFKLDTLDEISLDFILDPQLNVTRTINPDGMITLPGVGDVRAAGSTREELAKRIEKKYREAEIFSKDEVVGMKKYKLVTVTVTKFYEKVNKLVQSLTTLTGGQQTRVLIKPDGTMDFPLLKDRVLAAGHTVREVEETVNWLYRSGPLEHVVVSLALSEARSRKVYVMGQVRNPGAYSITQPITALQAIALAGGHLPATADLTSVILVSKDIAGKPIGRRLDLKKILDVGDMSSAILVKPYDVIYVPKTFVADVALFMDQYIRIVTQIRAFVWATPATTTTSVSP